MTDIAIDVRGLSKRYTIGTRRERHGTLRDSLAAAVRSIVRRDGKTARRSGQDFWALKDVSFQIGHEEIVGVIGRNGAGKSTLLKILSRITDPTTGEIDIEGRVGSLLEVGTGFHPELSGRENIFLNGAILGMSKREIHRRFEEIVAFAEIERFIDTPVKRYSSGMYVRLAFGVAAHLEPDILIVDEVLAVGDAAFQKKCLGKMSEVARHGRTILFVSHNMAAISALCSRSILLDKGAAVMDGPPSEVIAAYYLRLGEQCDDDSDLSKKARTGTHKAIFSSISVCASSKGKPVQVAETGCELRVDIFVEARDTLIESNVALTIYDATGYRLIDVNLNQKNEFLRLAPGETACVSFLIEELLLKPAMYTIGLWLGRDQIEETDHIERAAMLTIAPRTESQVHSVLFPGPYLCRFKSSISLVEPSLSQTSRALPLGSAS